MTHLMARYLAEMNQDRLGVSSSEPVLIRPILQVLGAGCRIAGKGHATPSIKAAVPWEAFRRSGRISWYSGE